MPLDQGIYRANRLLIPREWDYGALDFADGIVSRLAPDPAGRAGSGSVLFVRRPRAQGRSIVNEAELIEGLAGRYAGFAAVSLDDMSFTQQVSAFANARAVICPHGGGLSNIMFCAPGTIVVEFFFERSGVMYRDVSATRGLRYIGYIHARDGASQSGDETYKIDLVQLRRLLDSLLADAPAAA
jgi:capsular polysaccharide biosynthesis protein